MVHINVVLMCMGAGFYIWKTDARELNQNKRRVGIAVVIAGTISSHLLAIEQFGFGEQYFIYVMLAVLLLLLGVFDFYTYLLPTELLVIGYVFCSISLLANRSDQWYMNLIIALVGYGLLYGAGKLSGGAIGEGDAHVAAMLLLGLGWPHTLFVLLTALLLSAITGILMMIVAGKSRKTMLPFVPFVAIAHIGMLLF